ncbi:MAG: ATP-binding protein [Candidatus Omnitrophica bacterium]|nr:ATP-binding protein [Candidatus Omnitrophota bacterium]MBU4487798.1 ATP-binding protein [Candidatus Omnitrophota bacterium]MCG2705562.1 ATP-binding protein [Candidatus Omnitrophota bacterium]
MTRKHNSGRGRLRIGSNWNAITIIALSQTNPLKAIAEFVENSIDAQARHITIIRGKERGEHYLKVIDDGQGIPCAEEGMPDFKYVATHICDSLKTRLKHEGIQNIQGEFGIGLLSFWTVGHRLLMVSSGKDGKIYQMSMEKGKPGYSIAPRFHLLPIKGTQLTISPLLAGIRILNGEKIQRYLASELRDRIRHTGVKIKIIDRTSRSELEVEPRKYEGQLIHNLPAMTTPFGDVYMEIYLSEKNAENCISLFRGGTRLLPNISTLDFFQCEPWTSGYFQGIIDAPFLHITPGTRDGVIRDEHFAKFCDCIEPLKEHLTKIGLEQSKAEDERMSKNILRSVQKALREAMLILPQEEYDWFDIGQRKTAFSGSNNNITDESGATIINNVRRREGNGQREFFEIAGPLFSARIHPGSALVQAGKAKSFRAVGLDRSKRQVEQRLTYQWAISEGVGTIDKHDGEVAIFNAPNEPGLCKLRLVARQADTTCEAEAVITVIDSLLKAPVENSEFSNKGLPAYTLESAAGRMWRSRYDKERNIIIINSGHRDFIFAGRERTRKLRYVLRLFAKELVLHNFVGETAEQFLEHLVELSLYAEENLR